MAKNMWVVLLLSKQWNPGDVETIAVCPTRKAAVTYVEEYIQSLYADDDDPELDDWEYVWHGNTYSYVGNDEFYTIRKVDVING